MATHVIQLSRKKGSKRPPNVVVVDRSSRWGNPFRLNGSTSGDGVAVAVGRSQVDFARLARRAVDRYEEWVTTSDEVIDGFDPAWVREHVHELAGRTIGCWCALDEPCHRNVLARLADQENHRC
jgi:hypothetical protein